MWWWQRHKGRGFGHGIRELQATGGGDSCRRRKSSKISSKRVFIRRFSLRIEGKSENKNLSGYGFMRLKMTGGGRRTRAWLL